MQLRKLIGKALAVLLLLQPLLFAQSAAGFRFHSAGTTNPLIGFCTDFWKLADVNASIGTNNLTNVNTTTFSAGHIGNAATFVRTSSQALTHASGTDLRFGHINWTVAAWFKRTSTTNAQYIVAKSSGSGGEFHIRGTASAETIGIAVYNGSSTAVASFSGVAAANNAWHLIVVWYDPNVGANGTVYYALDGGATQSTAASANPGVSADVLSFGGLAAGASGLDGQVDAVCFTRAAIPSADQLTAFWAGGAGWEPAP